jgi:hypothetical protein
MHRLTSPLFAKATILAGSGLLLALGTLLPVVGCYESPAPRDPEDKDGVNIVPSPTRSSGVGSGGIGGGGGEGGGSTGTGTPCMVQADCEDGDPCTIDTCSTMQCARTNAADDGNKCTTDTCDAMTGNITNMPVVVTPDTDACTLSVCDPNTGVVNPKSVAIFSDDFSDNAAGWVLGPEWQVGTANESLGGLNEGNDPTVDNTMTNDNGIAGTVLGGLVANTDHAASFLTSPPINVTSLVIGESVTLRFHRWLNSDAPAVMNSTIEVSDGTTYTQVWGNSGAIFDSPPTGTGWFEVRLDVTTQAQAAKAAGAPMRVRFGFDHAVTQTASVGGWNIDDVSVERWAIPADGQICTLDDCSAGVMNHATIPMCQQ